MFFMFIARCCFARDTKWLFVLWRMWPEESLLSIEHIHHNTKAEGLQNNIGGFIGFRLKRRASDNIHYPMKYLL